MNKTDKLVPKLRFKQFLDEDDKMTWRLYQMSDVVEINSGQDYKHLSKGNIPVYGTGGYMTSVDDSLSNKNAIGIGRKGTIDRPFYLKAPFWTVDTLFYSLPKSNMNINFILQIFRNVNWKIYDESTGVPSLSKNVINKIKINIPSLPEQTAIGNFFKKIDERITANEHKLERLKQQKKGLLQKMFPKKDETVPEMRFKGFDGEWKESQLKGLLLKNKNKNKDLKVTNVESVSNKTGFTKQTDQFNNYSVASSDLSNYYVISEHQFAYNPSRINVGSIAYKELGDKVSVVSPLYVSFSVNKQMDDKFLWYWLKSSAFERQRQRLAEGGVRDTLSFNQLSEMRLLLPSISEQSHIGTFFQKYDQIINSQQNKINHLKKQKQALLQQMFV